MGRRSAAIHGVAAPDTEHVVASVFEQATAIPNGPSPSASTATAVLDTPPKSASKQIKSGSAIDDAGSLPLSKKRKKKGKSVAIVTDVNPRDASDAAQTPRSVRARGKASYAEATVEGQEADSTGPPTEDGTSRNLDDEEGADKKGKNPRKPRKKAQEPVYDIPPILEHLSTTFRGRLGYACINTVLRNRKPAAEAVFCGRTARLDTIRKKGLEVVKELGRRNVCDLLTILRWNEENGIRLMRFSSEMFPFASHEQFGYSLEYCEQEMRAVGEFAKAHGHRLTAHPGQYNQLGSPTAKVVANTVRELVYHAEMLDRILGTDEVDGIMIIHMGGTYGDKDAALNRFRANYAALPESVKRRLVLENDEICYSFDDLYPVCDELSIPIIYDYHHGWLNPSPNTPIETQIERCLELWRRRGIKPKFHQSEPRKGAQSLMELRAHSDRVQRLPEPLPDDVDLMLEAKDKEQAVFYLHRLYRLADVKYESLRPAAEEETMRTAGRKSSAGRKTSLAVDDAERDGDGDGEETGGGGPGIVVEEPAGSTVETQAQVEVKTQRTRRKRVGERARAAGEGKRRKGEPGDAS
jgi:UV DNA damage endonuclease